MAGRSRFVWHDGKWMPRAEWEAQRVASAVAIHRDFDAPLMCHADGKLHGSRSTYDAAVRAAGMVEVGRTEMRKLAAGPAYRGGDGMAPVAETMRRVMERMGDGSRRDVPAGIRQQQPGAAIGAGTGDTGLDGRACRCSAGRHRARHRR